MPASQASQGSSDTDTRSQIIAAAECLFAESGIDGVSLRQINLAAGQKNSSAAHYHFGSKQALISAIYEHRMKSVNARREKALEQILKENRSTDIRSLIEAFVYPIVEETDNTEGGSHYIRFMAQATGHPQLDLRDVWQKQHATGLNHVVRLLQQALPDIPPAIVGQRFGLAFEQLFHSLADREKLRHSSDHPIEVDSALFVSNLIDCIAGSMSAPVSAETKKELERLSKSAG